MASQVCQEPLDGVIGITALVRILRAFLARLVRPHHQEFPLGFELSANILEHENVAVPIEFRRRAKPGWVIPRTIRCDRIGRSKKHDRILLRGVLRSVDEGEELHTITHRYHVIFFVVVLPEVAGVLRQGSDGARRRNETEKPAVEQQRSLEIWHVWNPAALLASSRRGSGIITSGMCFLSIHAPAAAPESRDGFTSICCE